jgi:hypothetical protein
MRALSIILLALVVGFFAGHGTALPVDLIPLIVAIVTGFIAMKATEQYYQH